MKSTALLMACLLGAAACAPAPGEGAAGAGGGAPASAGAPADTLRAALAGTWRAVVASPGGELPFTLRIEAPGHVPPAVALNAGEGEPFTAVTVEGRRVELHIDGYDSVISAVLAADGKVLHGQWRKTAAGGSSSQLPFTAFKGETHRFGHLTPRVAGEGGDLADVSGDWSTVFVDDDEVVEPALATFVQQGTRVTGTFQTPTGDYRFLEGDFSGGLLRLSAFDGGHVFLFQARVADGGLAGEFWSRDSHHATWTAQRAGAADTLPDPYSEVTLKGEFTFTFPDLEGRPLSLDDPRFRGKVVMVNLFGSWCPNCNDEARLLAAWHRRYREQGLEMVGLAFEFTGSPERDRIFVRRYAERHGIEFPLLLAGVSDRKEAARVLPGLSAVKAYPTMIFIGRDGQVRRIYSGFSGPATGSRHTQMVAEFENLMETLLAEPAGPRAAAGN